MSWISSAVFLSILLLHCLPETVGEKTKTKVVENWYDGFKGRIKLKLTDDVTDGWTMRLSFPVSTPNLQIWRAEIVDNQHDKVYTMKNKPWNSKLSKGTVLKLDFIAEKSVVSKKPPKGKVFFKRGGAPPTGQPPTPSTWQPPTAGPSPPEPTTDSTDCTDNPSTTRPPKTTKRPPRTPFTKPKSTTRPPKTTKSPPKTPKPTTGVPPKPGKYDYGQVLKLSILFYEAQQSGKLPQSNRVQWRKDSALNDKGQNGEDLTGGWYDAGDYVKFGFPMAYSATVLAWGLVEYKKAYEAAGQYNHMLSSIKWATDYFIKAHTKKYEFYGQVCISKYLTIIRRRRSDYC